MVEFSVIFKCMAVKKQEEISLRYAQGEVFNCDKRFRVLVAGRRFGK